MATDTNMKDGFNLNKVKWWAAGLQVCVYTCGFLAFPPSVLCWAMDETFSSRERSLDWVAWEMKFTTSSGTSVTPSFLAEDKQHPVMCQSCHWNTDVSPDFALTIPPQTFQSPGIVHIIKQKGRAGVDSVRQKVLNFTNGRNPQYPYDHLC